MGHSVEDYIIAWRECIEDSSKSWVMFENGTCVILMHPEEDLAKQAQTLLNEWGVVEVGTPSADFNIITLFDEQGWVVTCHHNDILNYVFPNEGDKDSELAIGLLGRSQRATDAQMLKVVHIEDNRS